MAEYTGQFNPQRLSLVYSGGGNNLFPNNSLGGSPSAFPVLTGINNLFDDSFPGELQGNTDYRCFYVFNDNTDAIFENSTIWIESETVGGANVQLGIKAQTEKQKIVIEAISITGGTLTMEIGGCEFTFAYDSDISVWAANLESALSASCEISTNVTGTTFDATATTLFIFDVDFDEDSDNHAFDLITYVSSTLTGSGVLEPAIQRIQSGGPINEVAPEIGDETTPPAGVVFSTPTRDTPLNIGTLKPNEGFPVWVQRITPIDAEKTTPDSFIFKVGGRGTINI